MQSTITRDLAQEFRTGTNLNKYKLSSIDLFLTGYSSPETVKIYRGVPPANRSHRRRRIIPPTGSPLRRRPSRHDDDIELVTRTRRLHLHAPRKHHAGSQYLVLDRR